MGHTWREVLTRRQAVHSLSWREDTLFAVEKESLATKCGRFAR
jgi:hypothetical protein